MELPEPIVTDILSRLPVKSISNCRLVCKSWQRIILDPHFAKLHLSRSSSSIQFLLASRHSHRPPFRLAQLEEVATTTPYKANLRINHQPLLTSEAINQIIRDPDIDPELCSLCNGVLCIKLPKKNSDDPAHVWHPYLVYNPLTGDHVIVPSQTVRKSWEPFSCMLGFCWKTNEVKLLQFAIPTESGGRYKVVVQTLGSNSWRYIGTAPALLNLYPYAPFLNGALHWTADGPGLKLMYSFDFEEEKFHLVPPPLEFSALSGPSLTDVSACMTMGSFGDRLCFSLKRNCVREPGLDIWVMHEYGVKESWAKMFVIDDATQYYIPLRYHTNGKILMLYDKKLLSYNPKTKKGIHIKLSGIAVPHVPSFIKLLS